MLRFLYFRLPAVIVLLLFIVSCTTTVPPEDEGINLEIYETPINFSDDGFHRYLKTGPSEGAPLFFASVQRMSNREEEKTAALLNASEQASKFIAVKAVSRFMSERLNTSLKYIRDLDIAWDRDLALGMIDNLEILNITQDTYGTYLIARLPNHHLDAIPWKTENNSGIPLWTSRIPRIPGYIVSVGIALQTGNVPESFAAADNQALEEIAKQISVEIISNRKQIENSIGSAVLQTNYEISEVVIPGFYVLERWRTPDARYYYSLAIAPDSIIANYRND